MGFPRCRFFFLLRVETYNDGGVGIFAGDVLIGLEREPNFGSHHGTGSMEFLLLSLATVMNGVERERR